MKIMVLRYSNKYYTNKNRKKTFIIKLILTRGKYLVVICSKAEKKVLVTCTSNSLLCSAQVATDASQQAQGQIMKSAPKATAQAQKYPSILQGVKVLVKTYLWEL